MEGLNEITKEIFNISKDYCWCFPTQGDSGSVRIKGRMDFPRVLDQIFKDTLPYDLRSHYSATQSFLHFKMDGYDFIKEEGFRILDIEEIELTQGYSKTIYLGTINALDKEDDGISYTLGVDYLLANNESKEPKPVLRIWKHQISKSANYDEELDWIKSTKSVALPYQYAHLLPKPFNKL